MPSASSVGQYALPDPVVSLGKVEEIAENLVVIADQRVPLVPNIGLIGGREAVLVIDTGMGPSNAETVLTFATEYAQGRELYLTTTHFHPEHAFGAQVFADAATYVTNRAQADDLKHRGANYLHMFRGLGETVARRLDDVAVVQPDLVYDTASHELDLGGRVVELTAAGQAHTMGDQLIRIRDADVLFTGDLVEAGQFAIFPWFPPHDTDVSGLRWLALMERLAADPAQTVVPGHGDVGGPELLADVRDYLRMLRDETWKRRDSAMSQPTIIEEVSALMIERRPEWQGREWLATGVACMCSEYEHTDHDER
ncbi:MBL fold metallo-hydrolase [Nocardia pneumoniae]|uniref:MBL fold metallo-hydrolase n=1 Tax=Nocardia pneumoniae TaxID=228601 RepID=UPI000593998C|nr:MBL fold metallo-hydrolase [Nocardia pneumoniae]